jgi:hypothetical protein
MTSLRQIHKVRKVPTATLFLSRMYLQTQIIPIYFPGSSVSKA